MPPIEFAEPTRFRAGVASGDENFAAVRSIPTFRRDDFDKKFVPIGQK